MAKKPTPSVAAVRQAGVFGGAAGVAAASARVANDLDTSPAPKLVAKYAEDPEHPGNSILRHVVENVTVHAPAVHDIIRNAADTGMKVAAGTAAATLLYHGGKAIHRALGRQFK